MGSLLGLLRRRRLVTGVRDVRLSGAGSLRSRPGWRERSLEDSGVCAGSELQVDPFVPASLLVLVFDPTRSVAVEVLTVPFPVSGEVWGIVRCEVERRTGRALQSALAFQVGSLYLRDGHQRRSLRSYNSEKRQDLYLDEDDGAEEDKSQRTHFLLDIAHWGIAAAPSQMPLLLVDAPSTVARVSESGDLLPADEDALLDRRAVLLLRGLVLSDRSGNRAAVKLWMLGGHFVDVDSGAVHEDEEAATSAPQQAGGQWSRLWLVARSGARLPRYRLPADEVLRVRHRRGVEVEVEDGLVRAAAVPDDVDGSSWIRTREVSDLHRSVTQAMSRRA